MTKGGRPAFENMPRYENGRINYTAAEKDEPKKDDNAPSPRVKAERDLFNARCFQGGGHGAQCYDPLGQLFLVGKLDNVVGYRMSGQPVDLPAKKILEEARGYWNSREFFYRELGTGAGGFERSSKETGAARRATRLEREYLRYQRLLKGVGQYDLDCLHELMEMRGGDFGYVVSRIVQTELLRKNFRLPLAELACDRDDQILRAAKRALIGLCGLSASAFRMAA